MQVTSTGEDQVKANIAIVGQKEATKNFKISASGHAFKILSSTLYSNKIEAVVREIVCNAIDSHIRAGKSDVPVKIILTPSEFSVEDQGVGISHDKIVDVYATYFSSTKTNDDEQIGGFGLGSKAPFAYSDNFTVTCDYDGAKCVYAMTMQDDVNNGAPAIRKMLEMNTDKTGIKVSVPILAKDQNAFKKEVYKIALFQKVPISLNEEPVVAFGADIVKSFEEKGFVFFRKNFQSRENNISNEALKKGQEIFESLAKFNLAKNTICYGGIIYYIDNPEVNNYAADSIGSANLGDYNYGAYNDMRLILFMPPSSISVTPSREAISWDSKTIAAVKAQIDSLVSYNKRAIIKENLSQKVNTVTKNFIKEVVKQNKINFRFNSFIKPINCSLDFVKIFQESVRIAKIEHDYPNFPFVFHCWAKAKFLNICFNVWDNNFLFDTFLRMYFFGRFADKFARDSAYSKVNGFSEFDRFKKDQKVINKFGQYLQSIGIDCRITFVNSFTGKYLENPRRLHRLTKILSNATLYKIKSADLTTSGASKGKPQRISEVSIFENFLTRGITKKGTSKYRDNLDIINKLTNLVFVGSKREALDIKALFKRIENIAKGQILETNKHKELSLLAALVVPCASKNMENTKKALLGNNSNFPKDKIFTSANFINFLKNIIQEIENEREPVEKDTDVNKIAFIQVGDVLRKTNCYNLGNTHSYSNSVYMYGAKRIGNISNKEILVFYQPITVLEDSPRERPNWQKDFFIYAPIKKDSFGSRNKVEGSAQCSIYMSDNVSFFRNVINNAALIIANERTTEYGNFAISGIKIYFAHNEKCAKKLEELGVINLHKRMKEIVEEVLADKNTRETAIMASRLIGCDFAKIKDNKSHKTNWYHTFSNSIACLTAGLTYSDLLVPLTQAITDKLRITKSQRKLAEVLEFCSEADKTKSKINSFIRICAIMFDYQASKDILNFGKVTTLSVSSFVKNSYLDEMYLMVKSLFEKQEKKFLEDCKVFKRSKVSNSIFNFNMILKDLKENKTSLYEELSSTITRKQIEILAKR